MAEEQILELTDISRTSCLSQHPASMILPPSCTVFRLVYLHSHLLGREAFSKERFCEGHGDSDGWETSRGTRGRGLGGVEAWTEVFDDVCGLENLMCHEEGIGTVRRVVFLGDIRGTTVVSQTYPSIKQADQTVHSL